MYKKFKIFNKIININKDNKTNKDILYLINSKEEDMLENLKFLFINTLGIKSIKMKNL